MERQDEKPSPLPDKAEAVGEKGGSTSPCVGKRGDAPTLIRRSCERTTNKRKEAPEAGPSKPSKEEESRMT